MTRGVHRVTAGSVAGRRMTQAKGARIVTGQPIALTQEQLEWNRRVDAAKKVKRERSHA